VYVLQKDNRQPILVAIHHEASRLFGAVYIQHAAELIWPLRWTDPMMLVGNDTDRKSAEARRAADERLAEFRFVLVKGIGIEQTGQHVADFVIAMRILGENFMQMDDIARGRLALITSKRRCRQCVVWPHSGRKPAQALDTRFIIDIAVIDCPAH